MALRLQIELIYDPGCTSVERARDVLTAACREAGVPAVWTEWNSAAADCPRHARNRGSPTILVNGEDVAPGPHAWTPHDGPRQRMYRDGDALVPVPPLGRVVHAITAVLGPAVG
ncbi:MAG TPA: hypothetical protein VFQ22_02640 [Longimicrobiales bacterium]|nr:hypothetical protein [Longimicrobiales bacterium]